MDCYEEGDALHGAKIYAESRKMTGPAVYCKERQKRAQSITLIEYAEAVIIQKLRWIPEH